MVRGHWKVDIEDGAWWARLTTGESSVSMFFFFTDCFVDVCLFVCVGEQQRLDHIYMLWRYFKYIDRASWWSVIFALVCMP